MEYIRCKKVYTGYTIIEDGLIAIDGEKISMVDKFGKEKINYGDIKDYGNYIAIPGFIDIHNHGGYGIDFMNSSAMDIEKLTNIFPEEGITSVVATLGAMKDEDLSKSLLEIRYYIENKNTNGTGVLGINIEGPFLNRENAGLQPEGAIINPNMGLLKKWIEIGNGNIKIMTIAPELDGAIDIIKELSRNNIVASAGHSSATESDMNNAIIAGCNQVTHMFNGMMGFHHRELGILGVALCNENIYAEMAGFDTYSILPDVWKMAFKLKGANRMILTTDALVLKGLPDGKYTMMDRNVEIKDGRLYTSYDGGNMHPGVPMTFINSVKNVIKYTGANLEDVVIMSSINPASQLKILDKKGTISPGKDADILILDEDYKIVETYCRGKIAYSKDI